MTRESENLPYLCFGWFLSAEGEILRFVYRLVSPFAANINLTGCNVLWLFFLHIALQLTIASQVFTHTILRIDQGKMRQFYFRGGVKNAEVPKFIIIACGMSFNDLSNWLW